MNTDFSRILFPHCIAFADVPFRVPLIYLHCVKSPVKPFLTHPLHNDWVTDYSLLFIIILCFKILDLRTGSGVEEEVPGGLAIGFPSVLRPRVSAAVLFRLPALPPKRLLLDFIRPYSKLHTTKSHCQCPNTVFSYYRKSPYRRPCRQIRKPVYAHKIFGVQSKLPSQILQIHNR